MSYPYDPPMDDDEPSYPPYPSPQGFGTVPLSQPMDAHPPGAGIPGPHVGYPPMEPSMYPPGPPGGGFGPPGGGFGPPGVGFGVPNPGFGPSAGAGFYPSPGAGFGPPPGAGFGAPPGPGFGPPMVGYLPPGGGFAPPAFGMSPIMQPYPGGYPSPIMGMPPGVQPQVLGMPMAVVGIPMYTGEHKSAAHQPSAPGEHHLAESHAEKQEERKENEKKEERKDDEKKEENKENEKHEEHKDEGTIKPHHPFEPKADAEALKKAMKGFGTNEKAIIEILTNRSSSQRVEIAEVYKSMFGKDLISSLKKELAGDFEDAVVAMMMSMGKLLGEALHKAMKGAGTKERILIEILCTATNKEIHEINESYHAAFGHALEKDIKSDTSGYLKNLLVSIDVGKRSESHDVHHEKAKEDAELLYKSGEKKWGTNESAFTALLATESYPQLRCVFEEYEKLAKHSFEEAVKKEFSGALQEAMLTIVKCVRNKEVYFAEEVNSAMKGMGTHDNTLIRLIVSRSEIDLKLIKEEYEKKYKKSLYKAITSDTKGDYKKILLGIVKD